MQIVALLDGRVHCVSMFSPLIFFPFFFSTTNLHVPAQPPLSPSLWFHLGNDRHVYIHTHTQTHTSNSIGLSPLTSSLLLNHTCAQFSQTSTRSLRFFSMGEPSLSRKSASVWPQCAFFPALNWTAETSAAGSDTAVRDMPHYCCCKCQSTKSNRSQPNRTHGHTVNYFKGRRVNCCVCAWCVCIYKCWGFTDLLRLR